MRIRRVPVRREAAGAALFAALVSLVAAAGETSLRDRLASASPELGRQIFRVCGACHSHDAGGAPSVGPNLWGVVGRAVASAEGYDRYTPAMASFGGVWSPERLDLYLRRPAAVVEGSAMVFPGIPEAADRADLIAWLALNSPQPAVFASKHAASDSAAGTGGAPDAQPPAPRKARLPDLGLLVAGEGAEETYAYCTACHSERIVAQQGLTRADWEELLEQMVEENGMTPIEEPDLGRVLSYLAVRYGPDRPNFPQPLNVGRRRSGAGSPSPAGRARNRRRVSPTPSSTREPRPAGVTLRRHSSAGNRRQAGRRGEVANTRQQATPSSRFIFDPEPRHPAPVSALDTGWTTATKTAEFAPARRCRAAPVLTIIFRRERQSPPLPSTPESGRSPSSSRRAHRPG